MNRADVGTRAPRGSKPPLPDVFLHDVKESKRNDDR